MVIIPRSSVSTSAKSRSNPSSLNNSAFPILSRAAMAMFLHYCLVKFSSPSSENYATSGFSVSLIILSYNATFSFYNFSAISRAAPAPGTAFVKAPLGSLIQENIPPFLARSPSKSMMSEFTISPSSLARLTQL